MLARARLVKGWALDDQSQLKEAKEAYSAGRQIFDEAKDGSGAATALNDLGIVLQKEGDLAGAESLGQARDYFRHAQPFVVHVGIMTTSNYEFHAWFWPWREGGVSEPLCTYNAIIINDIHIVLHDRCMEKGCLPRLI